MSGTIPQPRMSIAEVADRLRLDAPVLARQLLPNGVKQVGEWHCNAMSSPTGFAISVCVAPGPKQGVCGFWNGLRWGGDMLDLVQIVNDFTKAEAIRWAKDWLGAPEDAPATRQNLKSKRKPEDIAKVRQQRELSAAEALKKNKDRARQIWQESKPIGGAAAAYLRFRGLDPAMASDLRFATALKHPAGGNFPALLGRVQDASGQGVGIWRIYVKVNGDGKAPVENPKLGLGRALGGAVRIGGIAAEIAVAEGIETAVACRQLIFLLTGRLVPVWASLSTSGLRALEFPPEVKSVRIYADGDTEKFRGGKLQPSPGLSAAKDLAGILNEKGVAASIEEPPAMMDWLNVLNRHSAILNPKAA